MLVKKSSIKQNKVAVNNNANDILSAWIALEVLTPQAFTYQEDLADGNEKFIVPIKEGELPWEGNTEVLKPNTKVFYQVVLGTIDLKKAVTSLLEAYTDDQSERIAEKEAILAVAIVDKDGFLIKDATAVSISSFAWGINKALNRELINLEDWVSVEESYISELENLLRRYGEDGKSLPLDISIIEAAYNEILSMFEIPKSLAMKTFFAVRCYEHVRSLQPPESLLLNSFYIKDLASAKVLFSQDNATFNLQRYFGVKKPEKQFDLLNNTSKLEEIISPSFMLPARWPSLNSHSLILMQQAAVNLTFKELKEEGIIAVNGPPGTGKSTLLRDIVAGLVTQRAEVMSTFDDPADAFTRAGQKIKVGQGWLQPYKLDNNLKGFEMVIASSNNKAVENISAELPAIEAIGNGVDLSYFRALSDALLKRKSWGLIAAVLGNSTNRRRFQQSFWWDKEVGLSTYLAEASSIPQIIEVVDHKSGKVLERRRPKIIVESEAPSSHEEALKRWHKVREDFLSKLKESKSKISELEQLRSTIALLPQLIKEELESLDVFNKAVKKEKAAREKVIRAKEVLLIAQEKLEDVEKQLAHHKKVKPNLLAWVLRTENSKAWRVKRQDLTGVLNEMKKILKENNDVVLFAESYLANCEVSLYKSRVLHAEKSLASANAQNKVNSYQEKYGKHIIDEKFFSSLREQVHTTSPWCCEAIQSIRSEVFIAAINLHKAFIDAAAKPLRNNLGVLMGVFSGHAFNSEFLPDIWSSLFLVVPSLSTTFSSVEKNV